MIPAQLRRWFGGGPGQVTRADADRLLDGDPTGPAHEGLAHLLAAASGPTRPGELAGELDAVAAFRREYGSGAPAPRRRPRRRALVVAALSAVLLAVGGTAFAATTGRLPDAVQRAVDGVFSGNGTQPPTSPPTGGPSGVSATPGAPGTGPGAGATQSAAAPGAPPGADENRLKGLCRSWAATRDNPHANTISPEDLRVLAAAAGGEDRIEAYCAALTGATPAPATTTKPGNSNPGNGRPTVPPGGGHSKGGSN